MNIKDLKPGTLFYWKHDPKINSKTYEVVLTAIGSDFDSQGNVLGIDYIVYQVYNDPSCFYVIDFEDFKLNYELVNPKDIEIERLKKENQELKEQLDIYQRRYELAKEQYLTQCNKPLKSDQQSTTPPMVKLENVINSIKKGL